MGSILLKKVFPHIAAIITFLVLSIIYFYPQLQGEAIQSGDIVSNRGMAKEVVDLRLEGKNPLWTNSMFGGMPVYQISGAYKGNKLSVLERVEQLFFKRPIGYFIALMVGFYLMAVLLNVNSWVAIMGAIAFGFSVNNLVLFEAGHMTKLRVFAQYGPIIAGLMLVFKRQYLIGGIVFSTAMALAIYANHIQMTYYLGLILGIYVLMEIGRYLMEGQVVDLLKIGGVLSIGLILAVGASFSNLWTTYEYSKDTMRGKPILAKQASTKATSSSEVEGLEWNYAMQWSNGGLDLMATMIPGVVGGGSKEPLSSSSEFATLMRRSGQQMREGPLYWGTLPFTSGPVYVGAIMCFLFILGLIAVKGNIKWWAAIGVFLVFLLSLGKNFEGLNRLLFDYFPMYSKFRAPSSMTSVSCILIPLLGMLGLSKLLDPLEGEEVSLKQLYLATGISAAIPLFFVLIGPSMFDFTGAGDTQYKANGILSALIADRKSLMRADAFRSLLLILVTAGLLWAYLKEKVSRPIVLLVIVLLVLFDTWQVGKRYLGIDKFSKGSITSSYVPRPVDEQIFAIEKIDINNRTTNPVGRGGYRVLDVNNFQTSRTSYYHNTVGGYHPAKLQRIQDLIDRHISQGNPAVLNMLNTKYIISREQKLQSNPDANGPAWFVETIQKVATPIEEIDALKGLNTLEQAVVLDSEFGNYLNNFDPARSGTISLTSYQPDHLTYATSTTSEQLAVFSEIWYGPNKGWQAYIDGEPVEHIRANYALRAMKIPTGSHKVEFKFEPRNYYIGENISLASSLLILLAFLGIIGSWFYRKMEEWKLEEPALAEATSKRTIVKPVATKRKLTKTKSKVKKEQRTKKKKK